MSNYHYYVMRFRVHVFVSFLFSFLALFLVQPVFVLFIFLAHFVPSIEYFLKHFNQIEGYGRKRFHNLFVWAGFSLVYLLFLPLKVVFFMSFNHVLHLVMVFNKKGVELLYPVSHRKYRFFSW